MKYSDAKDDKNYKWNITAERQTHSLSTFGDNNKGPKICHDQHDDDEFFLDKCFDFNISTSLNSHLIRTLMW